MAIAIQALDDGWPHSVVSAHGISYPDEDDVPLQPSLQFFAQGHPWLLCHLKEVRGDP
jgi:hypothetical protein